jgi:NAD(P)-dependent dehydrogenase (short-subunit alcohol dehydrogenase family)
MMSSPGDCARVMKEVVEQHGGLDVLVCNMLRPGLSFDTPVERLGPVEWDRHIGGYLSGPFYLVRAALVPMLEQGHGRSVVIVPVDGGLARSVRPPWVCRRRHSSHWPGVSPARSPVGA